MKNLAILFVPMLAISACGSTDSRTRSGFQTPSNIGYLGPELSNALRGTDINPVGDGYAYVVGEDINGDFAGYSGIIPTTLVSAPPASGSATWSGTYNLAQITGIELPSGGLQGYKAGFTGALTLTADFAAGTLIGTSPELSVTGAFTGSTLSGSTVFRGLSGTLIGQVGATGAVGAFHGNGATDLYAGGFIVGAP